MPCLGIWWIFNLNLWVEISSSTSNPAETPMQHLVLFCYSSAVYLKVCTLPHLSSDWNLLRCLQLPCNWLTGNHSFLPHLQGRNGEQVFSYSKMTPLSKDKGCIVLWATFPDGWHMFICFPAAISLFFTVRWSVLMIPVVSLQQIPGYQQSNSQCLTAKTQLYPILKCYHTQRTPKRMKIEICGCGWIKEYQDETKCQI